MLKRSFDILISAAGLIALSLPILGMVVWVRLDSEGPGLFGQSRVGEGGKIFKIYKMRTMVADAEQLGVYSTQPSDPRITRAGALLRRTSLDELPQLFNVLRGDMSLVGPRPDTPHQRANYSAGDWQKRISVRPGITGLAQARLRSSAKAEERLALDLAYVDRPTFWHDLIILWETARTLFNRKVT